MSGAAQEPSDEALMRGLAAGDDGALAALYARHAPLVFGISARSLGAPTAEEIVQGVFLALWQHARDFDPERGPLRPWLLQIARRRILNELRRRRRRPAEQTDREQELLAELSDPDPGPFSAAWRQHRRDAVRAALELLPPAQRQALGLAFFEELTHEQVAEVLELPLGTAKTRIRAGLQRLRRELVPGLVVVALALSGVVATLVHRQHEEAVRFAVDERALDLVTSSEVTPVRLEGTPAAPIGAHATYRARPGGELAVLTLSHFPAAATGRTYQAWIRRGGTWISLGTVRPDPSGHARMIVQSAEVAAGPEALQITLEPETGSSAPTGPPLAAWTAHPAEPGVGSDPRTPDPRAPGGTTR
jgi:RNA polymerase sigma factor (sigma-70 family)